MRVRIPIIGSECGTGRRTPAAGLSSHRPSYTTWRSYMDALDAYRRKAREEARDGFEACLAIAPCDAPSKVFMERIAQFRATGPCGDWNGVWSLIEK